MNTYQIEATSDAEFRAYVANQLNAGTSIEQVYKSLLFASSNKLPSSFSQICDEIHFSRIRTIADVDTAMAERAEARQRAENAYNERAKSEYVPMEGFDPAE
jgi:hypothetical protein